MIWPNLEQTPWRRPRRLFSARVSRKFLTVAELPPACLLSSATMADLSSGVSVGAARICGSLVSFSTMAARLASALGVGSSDEDLEGAVECKMAQPLISLSLHFPMPNPVSPNGPPPHQLATGPSAALNPRERGREVRRVPGQ